MDISMVYIIFFIFFSNIICEEILGHNNSKEINVIGIGSFGYSSLLKELDYEFKEWGLVLVSSIIWTDKRFIILRKEYWFEEISFIYKFYHTIINIESNSRYKMH